MGTFRISAIDENINTLAFIPVIVLMKLILGVVINFSMNIIAKNEQRIKDVEDRIEE